MKELLGALRGSVAGRGGVKAELARLALANDRYGRVETIPTHQSDPGPVHWKYPRRTHCPVVLIWRHSGVPTGRRLHSKVHTSGELLGASGGSSGQRGGSGA